MEDDSTSTLSLKRLFLLMGGVSALMVGALLYTKLYQPGHVSLAEVRAIDRLCQRYADDIMTNLTRQGVKEEPVFFRQIHECLAACRAYLVTSRAKGVTLNLSGPVEVPACLMRPTGEGGAVLEGSSGRGGATGEAQETP
jgi:hypothetical protein